MLIRVPEGWPQPVVATIAMVLLAALDLGGSFAAKEAVDRRSIGLALTGAALFLAVFWVYISSLQVAELSAVTFGWIVILQVGVVLLDRYRYGVLLAPGAWVAIVILLAAQAYLVLAPSPVRPSAQGCDQGVEAVQAGVAQSGQAEGADPDPADQADQECLPDSLVAGVRHVSPQRKYQPSASLTTKAQAR
jgi:hypothetical protein